MKERLYEEVHPILITTYTSTYIDLALQSQLSNYSRLYKTPPEKLFGFPGQTNK